METAQEEMAQKRRKLHGRSTSIYTDEELRQQQELLFQQVYFIFQFNIAFNLFIQARDEAQQLEDDDWARTQELSKDVLKKKIEATRTDDDNYDD
jgi:high-affinity Fe2+/Pb2+ permease